MPHRSKLLFLISFGLLASTDLINAAPATQCEQRPGKPAPTVAEQTTVAKLNALRQCSAAVDDRTACNVFLGKALEILFNNTDFKTGAGSYMVANNIVNGLEVPGNAG
jgi:hypothetical protein